MTEIKLKNPSLQDVFPTVNIIKKIGFKEFKKLFEGDNIKELIKTSFNNEEEPATDVLTTVGVSVAFDAFGIIIETLDKCEDDFYTLFASLAECSKDEARKLDAMGLVFAVVDLFKNGVYADFFTLVRKFLK